MAHYIYQYHQWPAFTWDDSVVIAPLAQIRHRQGQLSGKMSALGLGLKQEALLGTLSAEALKTSEIEGEHFDPDQVRSSIAQRLGLDIGGLKPTDRHVDGLVEMVLDATQNFDSPLTPERLFGWQKGLFPQNKSGFLSVETGGWRTDTNGPMQVVSGPIGREKVHYEAPSHTLLPKEMQHFINWFNAPPTTDPVLRAAIAHLWFVTLHPFDDGNGRIARALTDMALAQAEQSAHRYYSLSAQIRAERKGYYTILEQAQKGTLNITPWLLWFLNCVEKAIGAAEKNLVHTIARHQFWEQFNTTSLNPRQKLVLSKLWENFEGKLTTSKWAKLTKCSQDTAHRDIQDLIKKNILHQSPGGGRSTAYELINGKVSRFNNG